MLDKISSDLAELMASKPDWAQIEEALAGKGDLEKVIAKADADYVEDLFKSLNANMESQLYDLRKSAEAGVSGAAEELESLSYKWANLQAALLDKADRNDLKDLETRMMDKVRSEGGREGATSGRVHAEQTPF